ncbi:MAG: hypothetical protein KDD70_06925, partial [Bdellovibrionales bacterium]|nr:hypothetical protein [Bdellovibrionales bacterium]
MSEGGKQEAVLPPLGVRMRGISIFLFPIVLVVVAADQYTKYLAERYLQPLEIIPVIDGVFNLTLHYNKG